MLSRRRGLVWDDVGFGKTVIVETALSKLFASGKRIRALVLATRAIASNTWQDELEEWEHLVHLRPYARSLVGLNAAQREQAIFKDRLTRIDTLNYEHIPWLEQQLGKRGYPLGQLYDVVIADEVTKLKSPHGKWFSSMARMVHPEHVPCFWGLTGSPSAEGEHQIWAPMYLVDYGIRLGYTYEQFASTFFVKFGERLFCSNENKAALQSRLRDVVTVLSAEDYKVIPEVMYNERRLHLPDELAKQYDKFEQDMVLALQEGGLVAANAAVLVGKCMQFTSGAAYLTDELGNRLDTWGHIHDIKLDALDSLFEELNGRSLLVGIQYRHEVERILKRFGKSAVHMHSGNVTKVQADWNAGKIPMLVAHPASCGHGLNLQQGGSDICFFSLPYGAEPFEQLIGRLRRPGQAESHVRVHVLLTHGTVDFAAWSAVRDKQSLQQVLKSSLGIKEHA